MTIERRTLLAGLAAGIAPATPALAAPVPKAVRRHRAFQPWDVKRNPPPPPLNGLVQTVEGGQISLREWIGPGPSILVLWALWCPPCIAEKPALAQLQSALTAQKSNTRLRCLQAYDDRSLADGRSALQRMRCGELQIARASPALERALIKLFGASPINPRRTSMPSTMLLDGNGAELGRLQGGLPDYWSHPQAVKFFSGLEALIQKG